MLNPDGKYVAFDLEFINEVIVCAASMTNEESVPNVWYDTTDLGIADHMSKKTIETFVNYLFALSASGYTLVTWGGVGSDFKLLSTILPEFKHQILGLCLDSVDVPFVSGTVLGMMMSLKSVGISLGFEPKRNSSTIPDLWRTHKFDVLQHVSTDTFMTVAVVKKVFEANALTWTTQKGHTKTWCPVKLYTVRECLLMPLPNVPFQIQDTMNPKILAKWMQS